MATLAEYRQQFPQYADVPDDKLADGIYKKYYVGKMERSEFDKRIGYQEPEKPDHITAGLRGALDSFSFGFDDEIGAALNTGFGAWGDFKEHLDESRRLKREAREARPVAYGVGQFAGALPSAFVPLGAAARAGSLGAKIGQGALAGAAMGGLYGLGSGDEGDRLASAQGGVMSGGLIGGAIPLAGRGIGQLVGRARGNRAVPSTEALRRDAQSLYKAADMQGVTVSQPVFSRAVQMIGDDVRAKGIDAGIHPKAAAALRRMEEAAAKPPTLQELETLRRVTLQAARSNEPAERFMAGRLITGLDALVGNLRPGDVVSGNASATSALVRQARSLWRRQAKGAALEIAWERAGIRAGQFSGSGFENALRTEVRQIAMNPKKMRAFTAEEQKALKRVAQGGKIDNILRWIGKLAPTSVVSAAGSGGIGYAAGGPLGAVVVPAIGTLGRLGATAGTMRNFRNADALIRNDGLMPFSAPAAQRAELGTMGLLGAARQGVVTPGLLDLSARQPVAGY